jgi:hypothetical protein
MKKYIMITLGIIMCLTLVSAGLITESFISERYEKQSELTTIQESRIKLSSNISSIDVNISPIECNNGIYEAKDVGGSLKNAVEVTTKY